MITAEAGRECFADLVTLGEQRPIVIVATLSKMIRLATRMVKLDHLALLVPRIFGQEPSADEGTLVKLPWAEPSSRFTALAVGSSGDRLAESGRRGRRVGAELG